MTTIDPGRPFSLGNSRVIQTNPVLYLPERCRERLHEILGPPTLTAEEDQRGMADYWARVFSCGLELIYGALHDQPSIWPGAWVTSDAPEFAHIRRHLAFDNERWLVAPERGQFATELEWMRATWINADEIYKTLYSFQVWRQDDNANVDRVLSPTSERDAKCLVAFLESTGHKQTYWYERMPV
jgi:hypothetical protein